MADGAQRGWIDRWIQRFVVRLVLGAVWATVWVSALIFSKISGTPVSSRTVGTIVAVLVLPPLLHHATKNAEWRKRRVTARQERLAADRERRRMASLSPVEARIDHLRHAMTSEEFAEMVANLEALEAEHPGITDAVGAEGVGETNI